jgi:hypothetical protein
MNSFREKGRDPDYRLLNSFNKDMIHLRQKIPDIRKLTATSMFIIASTASQTTQLQDQSLRQNNESNQR